MQRKEAIYWRLVSFAPRYFCDWTFFRIFFFHLPRTQKIQRHLFTIKDEKIRRLFDKGFFPLTQIKWKQMQQLLSLMSNDSFEMEKLNIRKITSKKTCYKRNKTRLKPLNVFTDNVIIQLLWSNWSRLIKSQVTVY
jgi:hypothetical protein